MDVFKILTTIFGPSILIITMGWVVMHADDIKDFPKTKHTFVEALEALKNGKQIHRAGDRRIYLKRIIEMNGKKKDQYGSLWCSTREFTTLSSIDLEDIVENDWIIND